MGLKKQFKIKTTVKLRFVQGKKGILAISNEKVKRDLFLEKVSRNAGNSAPKSQLSQKTKPRRQKGKNQA